MDKVAVIIGAGGQDSYYLAELLLAKGYKVIGGARRSSQPRDYFIPLIEKGLILEEVDVTDYSSVLALVSEYKPDHLYNLSAQSHVGTSFTQPLYTWDVDAKGVLNILEVLRATSPKTRLYQASTSEMFGSSVSQELNIDCRKNGIVYKEPLKFQDENTPFTPNSPYALAKLAAHHAVRLYRECYGLYACSGILFNHESERRGEQFVTRKISKYIGYLKFHLDACKSGKIAGIFPKLRLGNLDACRDWSHAEDVVNAMVLMLEADKPNDYVVGSGETHSVKEFLEEAFNCIGEDYTKWVEIDEQLIRPAEVDYLKAKPTKIMNELGWKPKVDFKGLVKRMVDYDTKRAEVKSSLYGRV